MRRVPRQLEIVRDLRRGLERLQGRLDVLDAEPGAQLDVVEELLPKAVAGHSMRRVVVIALSNPEP